MTATLAPATQQWMECSVFDLGRRLAGLLAEVEPEGAGENLPDSTRERVADLAEAIRRQTAKRVDRDLGSLFDLDDRLIELMDRADEEEADGASSLSEQLTAEITEYLEAFRSKVDRITGYWRWQETIARICAEEVDRFFVRKKAAEGRVRRLRNMLVAFMTSRGYKKLEGEKSWIGKQRNSGPSLMIDDRQKIAERFYQCEISINKSEAGEIAQALPEGDLRRRVEAMLRNGEWEIHESSLRAELLNNFPIEGAHLAIGHHVRIR